MQVTYSGLFLFLALSCVVVESRQLERNPGGLSEFLRSDSNVEGKRWAVLIAGSNGYDNYRHQADICHAYQILRRGGLEDENIIVFMYDDIAFNVYNPRPGVVINKPNGEDVYQGVPKDYTGEDVNVNNFLAAILGNQTGVTGGSGKVVDSGPDDYIFIYYADHGSPGILGMPSEFLTAQDLMNTLKQKHAAKSYKSMVIYVEACESGSMFEGLLPSDIENIYVITAANPNESSYATYCPYDFPTLLSEYDTCLGDLFSISWLEDSDIHDLRNETLEQQYQVVRRRTAVDNQDIGSHVMQYGNKGIGEDSVFNYIGTNPNNDHYPLSDNRRYSGLTTTTHIVNQHDASLLHFLRKYDNAPEGSRKKTEAHRELVDQLSLRNHIDQSIHEIISVVFGVEKIPEILNSVQSAGNPLVHDWDCFKLLVKSFRQQCVLRSTTRTRYDMKYSGAFANMCNAGVDINRATQAITQACSTYSTP